MQVIANGKTVIVIPTDPPRQSTGGVFLPNIRKAGHREHKGVIVAVGPEITATAGGKPLTVGDVIATSPHENRLHLLRRRIGQWQAMRSLQRRKHFAIRLNRHRRGAAMITLSLRNRR